MVLWIQTSTEGAPAIFSAKIGSSASADAAAEDIGQCCQLK